MSNKFDIGGVIYAVIMGVVSILGLFMASRAVDGTFYWVGFLLFFFGLFAIFRMIGKWTDHKTPVVRPDEQIAGGTD